MSETVNVLNADRENIDKWAKKCFITVNVEKTVFMVFSNKRERTNVPPVKLSNVTVSEVFTHTHLGLTLQ